MSHAIPQIEIDLDLVDPRLTAVYQAIESAQLPYREGPFGLYDYTDYGNPIPHHVRDFRSYALPSYGDCVFRTTDPELARNTFDRLTQEHIAVTAITATFEAFGLKALGYEPAIATADQKEAARRSPLYAQGDMELVWVNSGDLAQHGVMLPDPRKLGAMANAKPKEGTEDSPPLPPIARMKLYHVSGHGIDDCNTDLFVVARDIDQATALWNEHCVKMSWPRHEDDTGEDGDARFDPSAIHVVLPNVAGSIYDHPAKVISWQDMLPKE